VIIPSESGTAASRTSAEFPTSSEFRRWASRPFRDHVVPVGDVPVGVERVVGVRDPFGQAAVLSFASLALQCVARPGRDEFENFPAKLLQSFVCTENVTGLGIVERDPDLQIIENGRNTTALRHSYHRRGLDAYNRPLEIEMQIAGRGSISYRAM
jgi:hypothetical protein